MSSRQCSWCHQPLSGSPSSSCTHSICSSCHIRSDLSPSACPWCCYASASEFIATNQICAGRSKRKLRRVIVSAVCLRETKFSQPTKQCQEKHQFCSQCLAQGCNLCRFLDLRSQSKRSANDRRVIETCAGWEKIFHLQKYRHLRGSTDEDPSTMDVDSPPLMTNEEEEKCVICYDTMDSSDLPFAVCQHRFHQTCLEQWFLSSGKKSCPTCGRVYEITKGLSFSFVRSASAFAEFVQVPNRPEARWQ